MQTGQRVALAGIIVSGSLALLKITAGILGNSAAVVADGLESASDVFSSSFVLLGLTLAAIPPDENHPYGHGRVEILTGLLIGLLLTAGGAVISYGSLAGMDREHAPLAAFVVWPLGFSALAKSVLAGLKFHFGRKLKSPALKADAWNDAMDILSALTALGAVALALHNPAEFRNADHWGGFVVGLIVIFTGVRVSRETALQLMDTMPDPDLVRQIRAVASAVPGVRGVEKCFARQTGTQYHVDLHIEVDPDMTVRQSHGIGHDVQQAIMQQLDWVAAVLVHVEPAP